MKTFVVTGKLPENEELKKTLEKKFPNHTVKINLHPIARWVLVKESFFTVVYARTKTSTSGGEPQIEIGPYVSGLKNLLTGFVGIFLQSQGLRVNKLIDEVSDYLETVYGDSENSIQDESQGEVGDM